MLWNIEVVGVSEDIKFNPFIYFRNRKETRTKKKSNMHSARWHVRRFGTQALSFKLCLPLSLLEFVKLE